MESFNVDVLSRGELETGAPTSWGGNGEKVKAWFEVGAEIDGEASELAGRYPEGHPMEGAYVRPVYREIVMLSVKDPDGKDVICKKATEIHKREYPQAWARFEKTRHLTPVGHLPGASKAVSETATGAGIWWVEQLAEKTEDDVCDVLKPFIMRAKQYLMIAQGIKPRIKLAA